MKKAIFGLLATALIIAFAGCGSGDVNPIPDKHFTNDGEFAAKLSHPSSQIEKEYIVETSQDIPQDFPEKFKKGIRVEGKFYKCLHCEILKPRKIKIVLIEGKNREIRNVLESQNIGTKSLVRVRIGNVKLDELKPGEFRDLTKFEIQRLISLCENKNL